jgi:hypothetical protein
MNVDTHAMSTIAPKNAADRNVNHNANGTRDLPVTTLDMWCSTVRVPIDDQNCTPRFTSDDQHRQYYQFETIRLAPPFQP